MLDNPWKKLEEAHGIHIDWQQQDSAPMDRKSPLLDPDNEEKQEGSASMMGKMSDDGIYDRPWH